MKRTDPLENLSSYIMVHGGIDRHDRLIEMEWVRDVFKAAREVASFLATPEELDLAIDNLRKELQRDGYGDTPSAHLSRNADEGDGGG